MRLSFWTILIISFYPCCGLFAQNTTDSLELLLKTDITIEQKVIVNNKLAYKYRVRDPERSLECSNLALALAKENNLPEETQKALSNMGLGYKYLGNYEKSVFYQNLALEKALELKNKEFVAVEYNRLGIIYKRMGLYSKALGYYNQSLEIHKELDNKKGVANVYNNLGNIYRKRGDLDIALDYYFKTNRLNEELDDKESYSYILNNIGNLYADLAIYGQALEYHKKSLLVKKEIGNNYGICTSFKNIGDIYLIIKEPGTALKYLDSCMSVSLEYNYNDLIYNLNTSFGEAYLQLNEYEKALGYISTSIKQQEEINDISGIVDAYTTASKLFIKQGFYGEARAYLLKGLEYAKQQSFNQDMTEIYQQLAIVFERTGNYPEAFNYYKKYATYKDSIFNSEIGNKITELRVKQKSEEFATERTILEEKNNFQQLSIERKNNFIIAMIAVTILVLIVIVLIIFEYRNKHKTNKELAKINQEISEKNNFLQVLMNTIPNPIYYKNKDGHYLGCNKAFSDLHSLSNEKIIGKTVFDLYPEGMAQKYYQIDKKLIDQNGMEQTEMQIDLGDGSTKDIISYKNTFLDIQGKSAGLVGLFLDISERKRSENIIRESEQKLRHVNATKDKFFSIIAHDLKNPFTSILGFVNILNTEYEFLSDKEKLHIISNLSLASENTYKLLQNLLEWARTQIGKMEVVPEILDISTLANENISMLGSFAHSKDIKIISNVNYNTLVMADKNMIMTVLRNVLSNAVKFTNSGGNVEITGYQKNGSVEICIEDNGVGISNDKIEKLFKIDEHIQTKGTSNEMGSGLGLILCKEFVEQNKGSMRVESVTGVGSKFFINLPKP